LVRVAVGLVLDGGAGRVMSRRVPPEMAATSFPAGTSTSTLASPATDVPLALKLARTRSWNRPALGKEKGARVIWLSRKGSA
jgi:hypothetical protein